MTQSVNPKGSETRAVAGLTNDSPNPGTDSSAPAFDRTLSHVQTDVDFANRYRLEYVKHMMSIAAGIFALSVTFMREWVGEDQVQASYLLALGWSAMVISLAAGIGHMKAWTVFYLAYRKPDEVRTRRLARQRPWRIAAELTQVGGLGAGVALMLLFGIANL